MGCDIHTEIDLKKNGVWKNDVEGIKAFKPFPYRDYHLFDFLANVRSSGSPAIAADRGLTEDRAAIRNAHFEEIKNEEPCWGGRGEAPFQFPEYHSISWVLLSELNDYDYNVTFLNSETQEEISLREYLGNGFFENLARIQNRYPEYKDDEIRLFFYFDN
jgi:hypothetical protein